MALTADEYRSITGEPAPEDFEPCQTLAQSMLDARTLGFYTAHDPDTLPALIRRALQQYLAYQTQAVCLAGGPAALMEPQPQSGSLGQFSFVNGVGASAHCPAAAALLPLLTGYARCD